MPWHTLTRKFLFSRLENQPSDFGSRGNWGVDLQAGSQFGYKLLFVVLLAGIFAVFLQVFPKSLRQSVDINVLVTAGSCFQTWLCNRPRYGF